MPSELVETARRDRRLAVRLGGASGSQDIGSHAVAVSPNPREHEGRCQPGFHERRACRQKRNRGQRRALPCQHRQPVLTSESEHRPSQACTSARNVPRPSLLHPRTRGMQARTLSRRSDCSFGSATGRSGSRPDAPQVATMQNPRNPSTASSQYPNRRDRRRPLARPRSSLCLGTTGLGGVRRRACLPRKAGREVGMARSSCWRDSRTDPRENDPNRGATRPSKAARKHPPTTNETAAKATTTASTHDTDRPIPTDTPP